MYTRAYKSAVSIPPLLWVTLFLLVPYAILFCYSFWQVSPVQVIVHTWSLGNYRELLHNHIYLAGPFPLDAHRRRGHRARAAAGLSAGLFSFVSAPRAAKIFSISWSSFPSG